MEISEFYKIKREQRKLDEKLDLISSERVRKNSIKNQLLAGSNTRITLLSLEASSEIEKKYAEIYGANWRENLSSEKVEQIEKIILEEKRTARKEIEERILSVKPHGRSLIKKR